jgi:hypothetical protein
MKTKLRPHKVLGKTTIEGDLHALAFSEGPFADIVFSYTNISFDEDTENDQLKLGYEYYIHQTPPHRLGFDKEAFEKELGDFAVELLYYGLERDHLGYVNDSTTREDDTLKLNSPGGVLP